MNQSSNNQSQAPQPPTSSNSTVPLSFIQNILANMQRTQPQAPNSPPSNPHSQIIQTTQQAVLPDEALPQTEAKPINVIDLDDQSIQNEPANNEENEKNEAQEIKKIQQVDVAPFVEQRQKINTPEEIPINNCQSTEKIILEQKSLDIIQVNKNQIQSLEIQQIISSEQQQHLSSNQIEEIRPIQQSTSVLQSVQNNQNNNPLTIPSSSIGETLPAQIVNIQIENNRSPLASITNHHPSYAFRGISNFIDSYIPNPTQIIEQHPTPDFNAQTASNQQKDTNNHQNLPPLVVSNTEMEITQMDVQIPQPQPQLQSEAQQPEAQQPEPQPEAENNHHIIQIIEDQQIKLAQKTQQNHVQPISVPPAQILQVQPSNNQEVLSEIPENGKKQHIILEPGQINESQIQNQNKSEPKQIQNRIQMSQKSQEVQINQAQIVVIEDSHQEKPILDEKPQINTNQPNNVPNQLQFPSICNDSPQLTDINEIRKLLLTYLPPHLQELTQSLDDIQLRQMYLDIRAEQMKLSSQNVQNVSISQNAENTNNIIHVEQNSAEVSKKPVEPLIVQEKKKQAPKPTQPKKVARSNQPSQNQSQTCRKQEKKDVLTFNITTQVSETHNNQGMKSANESNKKGKKVKKQRKRIVTTVVQQVEYFDDSDNETPSKYSVLQNGQTKRKKPVNKAQMQSVLTQLCSLVKSLDLASIGNSNTSQ